ncbi:CBS domain-containing protein [Reinekea forsetii]|nr:CBS domain-containing protein [Reinekea forsetii]
MTANADDLKDITDFLAQTLPISALTEASQLALAKQLTIAYFPKRNTKPIPIEKNVYLVRSGAFEIVDEHKKLVDRLGEGEFFGVSSFLNDNNPNHQVYAIEDSLVYQISHESFEALLKREKKVAYFFKKLASYRSNFGLHEYYESPVNLHVTQTVESLIEQALVACQSRDSIQQAARLMRDKKVSCIVIVDNNTLTGIVTDRDIRNRVVANGLDIEFPVCTVATSAPVTINADAATFEAQLMMSQMGVHHLPVIKNSQLLGVITATDIVRSHSVSMVHLVDRIQRSVGLEQAEQLQSKVIGLLSHWIQINVSPHEIGEALAVIGDAVVRKAISIAQSELGDPPMEIAWLAFGSQARKEQSFTSDQDNGLILEREPNEAESEYFSVFCERVCQILALFGYPLCPGNIMASNPRWRKTKEQWIHNFIQWIETPNPDALLNASIFFDMRVIHGQRQWLMDIHAVLKPRLVKADLFLMHLTNNALRTRPPLGFFRSFIVKDSGEHEHELDIKHQGIALINDIARIVALSEQCTEAGTIERLNTLGHAVLSSSIKSSLIEAWLLLNDLKLESQVEKITHGEQGSNFINPQDLTPLRKAHLKNAFKAIEGAQRSLALTYLRVGGL